MTRCVVFGAVIASATGASSAQVFFDRAAWVAAAGNPVVSPDYSLLAPVEFADGVTTDLGGFFDVLATGDSADLNGVANFVFDFSPGGLATVEFTFDTPINAFAAVWSNTFVQDGFRVSTGANDYDLNALADPLGASFIGFVETEAFDTIRFTTTLNPGNGDDFVFFNSFEFAPIPAPASAIALVGLAATRRRR